MAVVQCPSQIALHSAKCIGLESFRRNLGKALRQVQLLRYRRLGMEKHESLGIPYPMADHPVPERSQAEQWIKQLAQIMNDLGIAAVAGTTTPF